MQNPEITITMEDGSVIRAELYPETAPNTVRNFISLVKKGYYDGLIFHRVIPDFMIQGGGLSVRMEEKPTHEPIANEAGNGLKNLCGTVAMARTEEPHSATAQFYINVVDNPELDHQDDSPEGFGYCVFGQVIEGMDVVNKIRKLKTKAVGEHGNVPLDMVVITGVSRFE